MAKIIQNSKTSMHIEANSLRALVKITSNLGEANGGRFQKNKGEAYRERLCNTHLNFLSFDFSIEISTFSFLLTSLLSLNFSFEISTFSLLSFEISTPSFIFF